MFVLLSNSSVEPGAVDTLRYTSEGWSEIKDCNEIW